MPVQGPQQPGFYLPGAEYFSLAPNTNIALQGRRRRFLFPPNTTAPPTTDNITTTTTLPLEVGFQLTSGIYIHAFWVNIGVSASGLTIVNTFAGLTLRTGAPFPDIILGSPTLTNPLVNIGTTVLSDRDKLIVGNDVAAAGAAGGGAVGTNLSVTAQVNVNNSEALAIQFAAIIGIIYTRLDGILE